MLFLFVFWFHAESVVSWLAVVENIDKNHSLREKMMIFHQLLKERLPLAIKIKRIHYIFFENL